MIRVICCKCGELVMLKPGHCKNDSHGFCQPCLNKWCDDNGLEAIEIFIPEGAIINEDLFKKETCGSS